MNKYTKLCDDCCKFANKYGKLPLDDIYSIDPDKFEKQWKKLFIRICKVYMGMDKETAKFLFSELVCGNWERLHITDDEKHLGLLYWLDKFRHDVFYCSDRWSMDRLCRTHWLYRIIFRELREFNSPN